MVGVIIQYYSLWLYIEHAKKFPVTSLVTGQTHFMAINALAIGGRSGSPI
jgi:hypothetical protein